MVRNPALLVAALLILTAAPVAATPAAAAPTAKPPSVDLAAPGALTGSAIPLRISWPAATPAGSPIYRYQLQQSTDGGSWVSVPLTSRLATAVTVRVSAWQVIHFRVRATDEAAQTSPWAIGSPTWMSAAQENDEAVELDSGWQSVTDSRSFGGTRVMASGAGDSAKFSFIGREVGWVANRGPRKGTADIYLDGALAAKVDLYKSSGAQKRVVFRHEWSAVSEHTIKVVVSATPGRPNVDVDAFVVLTDAASETLIGAGDIASCGDLDDEATAAVVAGVDGIVFTTGDNVYPQGDAVLYDDCYGPSWGAFRDRTRPVPGNHDYLNNPGAAPYHAYFGDSAGPAGRGWYRYQAGTWRIYALNSECSPTSACGLAQHQWLADDLAAEPHRCVAAMWHRPRWSTGSHGDSTRMAAIMQLLYDHGTELVLTGHDHGYQRYKPATPAGAPDPAAGIRQFVVGSGGASLYAFPTTSALLEVRDNTTHGVLRLDLAPGSYSWEFMPRAGRTFTDTGSGTCH